MPIQLQSLVGETLSCIVIKRITNAKRPLHSFALIFNIKALRQQCISISL
jgi:hypothetical protein